MGFNQQIAFSLARLPAIEFGRGRFDTLASHVVRYGHQVMLVTGGQSFLRSPYYAKLQQQFHHAGIRYVHERIVGEPSPERIDEIVATHRHTGIELVVAIGGGSALDAGKAIAGLLQIGDSVMDYLEGVGPEKAYKGPALPFIAVPTTAGTGSEATKNAVLSRHGENGFKKSFRDEQLVAQLTLVDPDLLQTCPARVIAANGMDALTQLLESYVSLKANRLNDALAIDGLRAARDGLLPLYESAGQDGQAREQMAYAALLSGINLAQTGLGSVHGLASPLGAFYPIPHGIVCGSLVAAATQVNIDAMLEREPDNIALKRYARMAEVLAQKRFASQEEALLSLVSLLQDWTDRLAIERLSAYGLDESGIDQVVAHSRGSSMKTNPIVLTDEEIRSILLERL
jgi:alcohol dehydrogenase class IV